MEVKLQGIQFAFFFASKNVRINNALDDSLKAIFNGSQNINTLPSDPVFDEIPSLRVSSLNDEKKLQGTRTRLDYFVNREVEATPEILEAYFDEIKGDISLIRQKLPAEEVKRIGYVLNFKFISETAINTSVLLADGIPDVMQGTFDNSSIRLVKKHSIADLNINSVLSVRLDDNKIELFCQRDFNTIAIEDYSKILTSEKIIEFINAVSEEIDLERISNLF